MTSRFGGLRAALSGLSQRLQGKTLQGRDPHGNQYFVDAKNPKKRFVEYKGAETLGDDKTIPLAWYQWLRHLRDTPPTADEIAADMRAQQQLAARVAELNAADAKLRLQEMAERQIDANDTAASLANLMRERDQRGEVSSWEGATGREGGRK